MKKLLMAAVVVSTVFFSSCKSVNNGDPKSVLMAFVEALAKKDIAAAKKLATAESKGVLDMVEMGAKMGTDNKKEDHKYDKNDMEYGDAKIDGDKATIDVKQKSNGESLTYTLKKENGAWKVAFDKSSMMNMSMDKMSEKSGDTHTDMNIDSLGNELKESLEKLKELKVPETK